MKQCIVGFLTILLATGALAGHDGVYSHGCRCNGVWSRIVITRQHIDKSPSWEQMDNNPPLSPRQALALSKSALPQPDRESSPWELDAIKLRPIKGDKWIYFIEYTRSTPAKGDEKQYFRMTLAVTMAGEVVEPKPEKLGTPNNRMDDTSL